MSLRADLKASLRSEVPLSEYTTMQVGGPAAHFAEPKKEEELLELLDFAKEEKLSFFLLGKGSNTIFSDDGYAGLVIYLGNYEQENLSVDSEAKTLTASSGIHLSRLVSFARDSGLGGAEFLCNVPGTVGGAVVMNAGFSRHPGQRNEIGDIVQKVKVMKASGDLTILTRDQLEFSYRKSNLQNMIVLQATLQLWKRKKEEIQKKIRLNFAHRNEKQDLRYPSSGSIFKNPDPPNPAAAKLIDQVGYRGKRLGKAMISEKHANYMVNLGGAKCSEIKQLIQETQKAVLEATGIRLETEVRIIENS